MLLSTIDLLFSLDFGLARVVDDGRRVCPQIETPRLSASRTKGTGPRRVVRRVPTADRAGTPAG